MNLIEKGIISSVGSGSAVVVVPSKGKYMTQALYIPEHIPVLAVGDVVAFVEFSDLTGVIITKLEG